jgi:hypothetical protein
MPGCTQYPLLRNLLLIIPDVVVGFSEMILGRETEKQEFLNDGSSLTMLRGHTWRKLMILNA